MYLESISFMRLQDRAQPRPQRLIRDNFVEVFEAEADIFAKTDDEDALPVLRNPGHGADDPEIDPVTKLILKRLTDHLEGVTAVMPREVLDVLKQKSCRPVVPQDPLNIKEGLPCFSSSNP